MDIIKVAEEIEKKIRSLENGRKIIAERAETKARAIAEYDKKLAITILKLKDKGDIPVSIIDKVARGECHAEKLAMELAEGLYKAACSGMDSLQAELNGWQSIFRHLSEK